MLKIIINPRFYLVCGLSLIGISFFWLSACSKKNHNSHFYSSSGGHPFLGVWQHAINPKDRIIITPDGEHYRLQAETSGITLKLKQTTSGWVLEVPDQSPIEVQYLPSTDQFQLPGIGQQYNRFNRIKTEEGVS